MRLVLKLLLSVLVGFVLAAVLVKGAKGEYITPELWFDAKTHAVRLSGGALRLTDWDVAIVHLPIEEVRSRTGADPHACVLVRDEATLYCRDDRPWQTDRVHHMGIVIHEAVHVLQPDDMAPNCRERQARNIQARWLLEQGDARRAAEVLNRAPHCFEFD